MDYPSLLPQSIHEKINLKSHVFVDPEFETIKYRSECSYSKNYIRGEILNIVDYLEDVYGQPYETSVSLNNKANRRLKKKDFFKLKF